MTGQLRTTLHNRADGLDTWDVDLDSIVRDGERHVRRRRTALAGGVAGVLAVAGGVTALAVRDHATTHPQPADSDAVPLTYAVGSVIHSGDSTTDVGVRVDSVVPADDGVVFTTPDLQVMEEHDGQVQPIGHLATASTRLVAADDGHYVGWWDGERFQLWPGVAGRTDSVGVGSRSGDSAPTVLAISDRHVWFWNGGQIWVTDKPESDAVYQRYHGSGARTVQDAAAGRLLVDVGGGMAVVDEPGQGETSELSRVRPQVSGVTTGDLSPDGGHWFTADGNNHDEFEVFDSATGQSAAPAYQAGHATPYAWLGDDTIAAWAVPTDDPNGPVSLLTCRVSTNACTGAVPDVGTFGKIALSGEPVR